MTDPPIGCAALCLGFTDNCTDVSAGPLTAQFEDDVQALSDEADANGTPLCSGGGVGVLWPCDVGVYPVQIEKSSACMDPPAGCGGK